MWVVGTVVPKAMVGLRPSFSSHVRFGERGAPVLTLSSVEPEDRNEKIRGIPHLAKNERDMGHGGFSLQVQHFQNRR
jgi:hypothetical protein